MPVINLFIAKKQDVSGVLISNFPSEEILRYISIELLPF